MNRATRSRMRSGRRPAALERAEGVDHGAAAEVGGVVGVEGDPGAGHFDRRRPPGGGRPRGTYPPGFLDPVGENRPGQGTKSIPGGSWEPPSAPPPPAPRPRGPPSASVAWRKARLGRGSGADRASRPRAARSGSPAAKAPLRANQLAGVGDGAPVARNASRRPPHAREQAAGSRLEVIGHPVITDASSPQGAKDWKVSRSVVTFRARPCQVTPRRTACRCCRPSRPIHTAVFLARAGLRSPGSGGHRSRPARGRAGIDASCGLGEPDDRVGHDLPGTVVRRLPPRPMSTTGNGTPSYRLGEDAPRHHGSCSTRKRPGDRRGPAPRGAPPAERRSPHPRAARGR